MTTAFFDEYASAIRDSAAALDGMAVVVNLVGGQTLSGTLSYAPTPTGYLGSPVYPPVLTVTVSTKAHTVRLDHVSSIGQS